MKNKFLLIGLGYLVAIQMLIGTQLFAQLAPNNDSAAHYLKLALADKQNGRRLDLLKKLDKAIAFQSQDPVVLKGLGTILADQRKFGPALEHFNKAIELTPKDTNLLRQTLELAYQLRQHEEVIRLAELSKKVQQDHDECRIPFQCFCQCPLRNTGALVANASIQPK